MNLAIRLQILIFSFFVLTTILVQFTRQEKNNDFHIKLFTGLVISTMLEISLEAISWVLNGNAMPWITPLAYIINSTLFAFNLLPLIFWYLYVHYEFFNNIYRTKKIGYLLMCLLGVNIIISYSTPWTKAYYILDKSNVYSHGYYFAVGQVLYFSLFTAIILLIVLYHKRVSKRTANAMFSFIIPPIFGVLLQQTFYGMSTIWASVTLSILICYLNIQNRSLVTDHLTGLYNRRYLDSHLQNIENNFNPSIHTAILLIDIDDFKKINDVHGHTIGDRAIEATANILRTSFSQNSFVARYGGDEFIVVFNVKDPSDIPEKLTSLNNSFNHFNQMSREPYALNISIGCSIYTPTKFSTMSDFIAHIDKKMYLNKATKNNVSKS